MLNKLLGFVRGIDLGQFSLVCVLLPPAAVAVGGVGVLAWMKAPIACAMVTIFAVWAFFEAKIREKKTERVSTLAQAASYMFTVAAHIDEVDPEKHILLSNDKFELILRKKET